MIILWSGWIFVGMSSGYLGYYEGWGDRESKAEKESPLMKGDEEEEEEGVRRVSDRLEFLANA